MDPISNMHRAHAENEGMDRSMSRIPEVLEELRNTIQLQNERIKELKDDMALILNSLCLESSSCSSSSPSSPSLPLSSSGGYSKASPDLDCKASNGLTSCATSGTAVQHAVSPTSPPPSLSQMSADIRRLNQTVSAVLRTIQTQHFSPPSSSGISTASNNGTPTTSTNECCGTQRGRIVTPPIPRTRDMSHQRRKKQSRECGAGEEEEEEDGEARQREGWATADDGLHRHQQRTEESRGVEASRSAYEKEQLQAVQKRLEEEKRRRLEEELRRAEETKQLAEIERQRKAALDAKRKDILSNLFGDTPQNGGGLFGNESSATKAGLFDD